MIKIKPSVLHNRKMTYAREGGSSIRIDCSDGINDLLRPNCCCEANLANYPHGDRLQHAICDWWRETAELTPEMLLLGNGSQQLLYLVNKLLVGPGSRVLGYTPQYSSYCSDVLFCGGSYRATETAENYRFDGAALIAQLTGEDTLVYLDNPNNPTGQCISPEEVENVVRAAEERNVCVFVDEAYGDYVTQAESAVPLLARYDNVIVSRTFSKAFGLAGLRLGYLAARPEVIRELKKLTTPYDGNTPARELCCQVLEGTDFLPRLRSVVQQTKEPLLQEPFLRLHIACTDSRVPILLLQHSRADFDLAAALAQEGLGVVSGRSFYGMRENAVRLRVPQPQYLQEVLRILRRVDAQK